MSVTYVGDMAALQPVRSTERSRLKASVAVRHPRLKNRFRGELWDLSPAGCRIVTREPVSVGDEILVKIEALESWPATVVWKRGGCCGVRFRAPLHYSVVQYHAQTFPALPMD